MPNLVQLKINKNLFLHGFFCKHPIQVAGNFICDLKKKCKEEFEPREKGAILFLVLSRQTCIIIYFVFHLFTLD